MAKGLINKYNNFLLDYKRLKPFQQKLIDWYITKLIDDPILVNGKTPIGQCHELSKYNHKGWIVMSLDVPNNEFDCKKIMNNKVHMTRGIRLIYEYIYTTKGELIINLTNCSNHNYKITHYSINY